MPHRFLQHPSCQHHNINHKPSSLLNLAHTEITYPADVNALLTQKYTELEARERQPLCIYPIQHDKTEKGTQSYL